MRIVLAGGGSGGSAAPVIAVAEAIAQRRPDAEFLYIGTRAGPERALVEAAGLPYRSVAAGRLRRFVTLRNAVDPWLAGWGVGQAALLIRGFAPAVAFAAGGFASVPPLLGARCLGVPIVVHQQDFLPGLANRILAPFASRLTVAFAETRRMFRTPGAQLVGNPVRSAVAQASSRGVKGRWGMEPTAPLVLALGGGTGALGLNRAVHEAARKLVDTCEIVHLTGAGKGIAGWEHARYRPVEFVTSELPGLLAAADVIVSRAGMSTLAEIAALRKAAILVPMPDSHQEANASAFERERAAVVLREPRLTGALLAEEVRALLAHPTRRRALGQAAAQVLLGGAAEAIAEAVDGVAQGAG